MNVSSSPAVDPAVAEARAAVDAVDAQIRALVAERVRLSQEVQRRRAELGIRGNQHVREVDVVRGYSAEWGRSGSVIALELLKLCRG